MHTDGTYMPLSHSNFLDIQPCFSFDQSTRTLTVGVSSDNLLAKLYKVRMKAKIASGTSTVYSYLDVTLKDQCYLETATPIVQSPVRYIEFILLSSPTLVEPLLNLFTLSTNHDGCFDYAIYD